MFYRKGFEDLHQIVEGELNLAIENHGFFKSRHEAWAVLREEVIEARTELEAIEHGLEVLDLMVRLDKETDYEEIKVVYAHAKLLAMEAVQVAAMALKWTRGIENEEHTCGSE